MTINVEARMHPVFNTYQVGDATITRVTETILSTLTPDFVYADWNANDLEQLTPGSMDAAREHLLLSVHTWVVQLHGQTMLIDTGIGNGKTRPFSALFHQLDNPFLQRLDAIGVRPEQVDHVLLTHLHADHIGWNTRWIDGQWVPTFPNARYVFPQAEEDFYATPAAANRLMVFNDSVAPVIESKQAITIADGGGTYLDGIEFHPTPGHSVGHMSISVTSRGEHALFTGDVAHHPLQVRHPEWNSVFCGDGERARASRRWAFDFGAERDALLFTAHFPESSAGRIERRGDAYTWRFA
jgi:glyoxylase-like metal-dependent hydrolase (beta-lactamase superfamily II)